jgi:hypothetical protein
VSGKVLSGLKPDLRERGNKSRGSRDAQLVG